MFKTYELWWDDVSAYLLMEVAMLLDGGAVPEGLATTFDASLTEAGSKAEALAFNVPRQLSEGFPIYNAQELSIIDGSISEEEGIKILKQEFRKVLKASKKLLCKGSTFMYDYILGQLLRMDDLYEVDMASQLLVALPNLAPIC